MAIKAKNIEGTERILVLNESIVMIDWLDEIEFQIQNSLYFSEEFKIIFAFSQEGDENSTTGGIVNRTFRLVLHKWNASPYVDASIPWEINIDGRQVYVRWRVSANSNNQARMFFLSIWV